MLVLTRDVSERVYLETSDGRIEVILVRADRGQARIGFLAPKSVQILRSELAEAAPPKKDT